MKTAWSKLAFRNKQVNHRFSITKYHTLYNRYYKSILSVYWFCCKHFTWKCTFLVQNNCSADVYESTNTHNSSLIPYIRCHVHSLHNIHMGDKEMEKENQKYIHKSSAGTTQQITNYMQIYYMRYIHVALPHNIHMILAFCILLTFT